jgi:glycosyltransferase involved in cell wall biosynthesis
MDWEMIVVDNNSDDSSKKIVEKVDDPRIRQIQINNKGIIAASRNFGASIATGIYLAFLDADDTWAPNKLHSVMSVLEKEKSEFVYHKLKRVPKGHYLRPNTGSSYRNSQTDILTAGNRIPNSSVVISRRLFSQLGGFDESPELVASEDFDLWIRVNNAGVRMRFIAQVLGEYFESPDGMNNPDRRILSAVAVLSKHGKSQIPGWLLLSQMLNQTKVNIEHQQSSNFRSSKLESSDSFVHFSDYVYYKCRKLLSKRI